MSKRMLINVIEPEEVRIAVLEGDRLEELYMERASRTQVVGNIYKARVVNVEASLDAAFVDFGGGRNGFLHAGDVAPSYLSDGAGGRREGEKLKALKDALQRGREIMVQVSREGIGRKAPRVTTYVSIPGRYLVLMPELNRQGVSRKIEDEETRQRLREMLQSLNPPEDMGFIIRTAGAGRPKRDLQRDMQYLLRLWDEVRTRFEKEKAPCLLYQESDLVQRAIRDIYTHDIAEILIDSEEEHQKVVEFMKLTMPRQARTVQLYRDPEPLFHKYHLEEEIQRIYQRQVPLPHGGSIVIDQTEALVAVDVNSGKYVKEDNIEETAFRTNLEAAPEIARQLRLRDLGGVMIIDFIDMEEEAHRHEVEQALWNALRRDRARVKMLRMSRFGIVEMTRQRMRESFQRTHFENCPYCNGTGRVKTAESVALDAFRRIRLHLKDPEVGLIQVSLSPKVADHLQNEKRADLGALEARAQVEIQVQSAPGMSVDAVQIQAFDRSGRKVKA